MKSKLYLQAIMLLITVTAQAQSLISLQPLTGSFAIADKNAVTAIYVDPADHAVVKKAATLLQQDIAAVTGQQPALLSEMPASATNLIIIGSLDRSSTIQQLIANNKINANALTGKWEAFQWQLVKAPVKGIDKALVIMGSDRRGTAFGTLELSKQIGVSPWYWWADVPVQKKEALYLKQPTLTAQSPSVKYRGIFINDEAPALSGWSKEKFGGFNHTFYEKVFELMLRLRANYIWPAMWGNAFYDDDSLNIRAADEYAIVIGTSHHEPLMRAHDEWRRYGQGKWNYDSNATKLKQFWSAGMQRATNEKIVSVGMRGDGDEPMSRETATALLERIMKDQRDIIQHVTGKPANETPQLWALYKEVQDYYDKGMRVPDDFTLLLCDDNWGNIRRLPNPTEKPRAGGYGIYYHFDYVGGPRNYKWINTNPIARVWEQMHLAWEYKARQIWIVNVGDIKPMEFPISFFLDYAWNPDAIKAEDLQKYTEQWCAAQFGQQHAVAIADIISKYTKYNGRRKPELLNEKTYIAYGELHTVVEDWKTLLQQATKIDQQLPAEYRDAYFQLVLHPVKACANLQLMYQQVARNQEAAKMKWLLANESAKEAIKYYEADSLITLEYHRLNKGKWNHMMDQTHIGYTYWQQPNANKLPALQYVSESQAVPFPSFDPNPVTTVPIHVVFTKAKPPSFHEYNKYVSINADHFTRKVDTRSVQWQILPDHGKTGNAVTPFPVTAPTQTPGGKSPHLEYDFYTDTSGTVKVQAFFSPTLNLFNNGGLKYAISIDDETPQIITTNSDDNNVRTWENWVANNIIIKTTPHTISKPGKHTLKYWMVDPAVVLQKLVVDLGGVQPSYLGPPETRKP